MAPALQRNMVFLVFICVVSTPTLYASRPCDHCSCDLSTTAATTSTPRRSILSINCSNTGVSNMPRPPAAESYQQLSYTEIHAEFRHNKLGEVKQFEVKLLTSLNLADNEIRHIEDGAFSTLTGLRDLDLSSNKLGKVNLNGGTFQNLRSLERLNLYDTSISKLDSTAFDDLKSLKVLNLGYNFLEEELDPLLFSNLLNLEELTLKENALTEIHPDTFKNLKQLTYLDISGNSLQTLNDDIYQSLRQLTSLDLSNNKLTTIKDVALVNLDSLTSLNLAHNEISKFDPKFEVPATLRVLNVGHNMLEEVGFLDSSFDDLQEVYVEHNQLSSLDFIKSLTQIQVLNASSNRITESPNKSFTKLHTLDLSNNSLSSIPISITAQYLPALRSLSLDMNPITEINFPTSPKSFTHLQHISLSYMPDLKELKTTAFSALRGKLVARGNLELAGELEGGVRKREVDVLDEFVDEEDCEENEEEESTEVEKKAEEAVKTDDDGEVANGERATTVGGKGTVVEESVQMNSDSNEEDVGVEDVKVEIRATTEVGKTKSEGAVVHESVEMVSNEGDVASGEAETKGNLRVGNLRRDPGNSDEVESYNVESGIKGNGKSVIPCKSPLVLKISHNKNLVAIEEGTFQDVDVCELDLSYNSLNNIPEKMADWIAVPSVNLQGNPWDCSCRLQWLLQIIVPKLYVHQPELLYELRCGSPPLLRDRRFVHFYNWSEPAFCTQHKDRIQVPVQDEPGDVDNESMLSLGSSNGMLIAVGVACFVVCLLVGAGIYLQRKQTMQKRARNRRV